MVEASQEKVCLCAAGQKHVLQSTVIAADVSPALWWCHAGQTWHDLPSLLLYLWHLEFSLPCLYQAHNASGYYPLAPHAASFCTCAWGWYSYNLFLWIVLRFHMKSTCFSTFKRHFQLSCLPIWVTFRMSLENPCLLLKTLFDPYSHTYLLQSSYRVIEFLDIISSHSSSYS